MLVTNIGEFAEINRVLFLKVLRFNLDVASYIHVSHLEHIAPDLIKFLPQSPQGLKLFSQFIIQKFRLEHCLVIDNEAHQIALLDTDTLNALILYAGVTLHAKAISTMLEKAKIQQFKDAFCEKMYTFALKRAPMFNRNLPQFIHENHAAKTTFDAIMETGRKCLEYCLSQAPEAVIQRVKLKFPVDILWNFQHTPDIETSTRAFALCSRLLEKEIGCYN